MFFFYPITVNFIRPDSGATHPMAQQKTRETILLSILGLIGQADLPVAEGKS